MLTFEECKEVVEKVWGVKSPDGWAKVNYKAERELNNGWVHESASTPEKWMMSEVNSWEGFGRTVEAMEKRGFCVTGYPGSMIGFEKGTAFSEADLFFEIDGETDSGWSSNAFRDATHRAALEAVKEAE